VDTEGAASYIEATYQRYCDSARENMGDVWEVLGLTESGDPRAEFISCWERVRVPAGQTLWETVALNFERLLFVPTVCRSPKYQQFVSLAGHLQLARGKGQHILLPVVLWARFLKVSPKMISTYRRWALEAGILRKVANFNRERRRADEFVFDLERFDGHRRQRPQ
jgi:hypothetical protein